MRQVEIGHTHTNIHAQWRVGDHYQWRAVYIGIYETRMFGEIGLITPTNKVVNDARTYCGIIQKAGSSAFRSVANCFVQHSCYSQGFFIRIILTQYTVAANFIATACHYLLVSS